MKKRITLFAFVLALAFPAGAAAHHDYQSVTLGFDGYSEIIDYPTTPVATPSCWQVVGFSPGEVKYIRLYSGHFGIGGIVGSLSHIHHPIFDTSYPGQGLRAWGHPSGSGSTDDLGSRRIVHVNPFGVWMETVRFRNNSASLGWAVRRNC